MKSVNQEERNVLRCPQCGGIIAKIREVRTNCIEELCFEDTIKIPMWEDETLVLSQDDESALVECKCGEAYIVEQTDKMEYPILKNVTPAK